MTDLYELQFQGIVGVHRKLLAELAPIVAGANESVETILPLAQQAAGFLLGHHDFESHVLFPGLRRHGRLRSTDVAFLEARDCDHVAIHRLCDELLATTRALHPHASTLAANARELVQLLGPHTIEEEQGLAPARMREMIDEQGFARLCQELEEARRAVEARVAAAQRA